MPRRNLDKFDATFQKVTAHAVRQLTSLKYGTERPLFTARMQTKGQALNTAMQLRQYWLALTAAAERGDLPAGDPREELARHAPMLAVRHVSADKMTIEVVHRSQLSTSMGLAQALGILEENIDAPEPVPTTPVLPFNPAVVEALRVGGKPDHQEDLLAKIYPGTEGAEK